MPCKALHVPLTTDISVEEVTLTEQVLPPIICDALFSHGQCLLSALSQREYG
jgi:hypothetical protein